MLVLHLGKGLFRQFDEVFMRFNYPQSHLLLLIFCLLVERIHYLSEFVSVNDRAALELEVGAGLSQKAVELLVFALTSCPGRLGVISENIEV